MSKGFENMGKEALSIDANTFQFFTRNPRGGKAKQLDQNDIDKFLKLAKENNFAQLLAHAPYTLNACAADESKREFAVNTFIDDLKRLELTPNNLYNFHPGSHVKQGVDVGIKYITDMLNQALTKEQTTTVLLETMAGKGTEVGRSFEELKAIIDGVEIDEKLGVCLDTCHVFDAGYDIVNNLDGVLEEFDNIIGLDRLKAIHLNDSLNSCGSHKDRHAKIGEGQIGLDAIVRIINHDALKNLPFLLETPNELDGYAKESNRRKIKLENLSNPKKSFPNSQKGRFITVMKEALDILRKDGEKASKQKVAEFKDRLKTKTKYIYENRSEYSLFDLSIKEYLAEIITDKTLKEITQTDLEDIKYPEVKGVSYHKSSDYEMKLKLSKMIMEYKIREKGGKR